MKRFNPKDNGVHIPFNDETFLQKWQEWLDYRKERRLPQYVARGLKATFTKLVNDSNNNSSIAIAIIEQSIALNYSGLFPLKNQFNGHNPAQSIGKTFIAD